MVNIGTMKVRIARQDKILMLIQLTNKDPEIKKRLLKLLQLSSYERRFEINVWLEKLRQRNASENLCNLLFILFDDIAAQQVLKLIDNTHH
jgi:hypothetical protein